MPSERAPSRCTPVVIINGLGAPRLAAEAYGMAFRVRGFRVSTVPQTFLNLGDVRDAALEVGRHVDGVRARSGAQRVHLVGMSLGGLIGLYYVKCGGGAATVARFVSVGGPLNGSTFARMASFVPSTLVQSLPQTLPDSELMLELRAAPVPDGVRLHSVGTRGDFLTPRSSWDADGCVPVETPHGVFPIGHWMLFLHPANQRVVADLLAAQ